MEVDHYLQNIYDEITQKNMLMNQEGKGKVKEILGTFPLPEEERIEWIEDPVDCGDYIRERVQFLSTEGLHVPMFILTPKAHGKEIPCVVAIHGHGNGSLDVIGSESNVSSHHHFAVQLVRTGIKVFAPEMIGFGERRLKEDIDRGKENSCYALAARMLMTGKSLPGLRVFEVIRTLDIIQAHFNGENLGVMGFSGGGWIAALTALVDERVSATVLSGFTSTFKGSIYHTDHCLDNYLPGILEVGELPSLLGGIAPRPLFIEHGRKDHCFPVTHANDALETIRSVYRVYHAEDNVETHFFDGGHEVNGQVSSRWVKERLSE
ncbi:alpha/beta hydrolase family protein [Halobacillus litoralis]|uniref:dienelactone hydrolase family protein n=1 Tax=Halobacillus litoralis TaxID=45668 RepID=UPI001CFE76CE|nr:alpha/beta hydrolase family protein [Halobacillus litoralis]WLR48059.1 alpha/beta hydrolase family protein [Halobacillus litoralis]